MLDALRRQVEAAQAAELARALAQLEHLDEHDREVIRQFGQRMVEQLFLQLAERVRQIAEQAPTDARLGLLTHLLGGAEAPTTRADRNAPAQET